MVVLMPTGGSIRARGLPSWWGRDCGCNMVVLVVADGLVAELVAPHVLAHRAQWCHCLSRVRKGAVPPRCSAHPLSWRLFRDLCRVLSCGF